MKKKLVWTPILAVLALVFTSACMGGSGSTTPSTSHPDYLRWPGGDPVTLDPHLVTDVGSHSYAGNIFSGLLRLDPAVYDENGEFVASGYDITQDMIEKVRTGVYTVSGIVVPDLAESMPEKTVNSDGTVSYIFKIRDDAKFQNGRKVTAWDFAYSFDRATDPRTNSSAAELYLGDILGVMDMQRGKIINRVSPGSGETWVDLPGVKVIDERTLQLTIDADKSYFLQNLTYPTAYVIDKVQVEATGNWTDRPNGTGPYRLVKRDISEIVLEANPYYCGPAPQIKKVVFYITGGPGYERYRDGSLDATGIGIADLALLEEVRNPNSDLGRQYFETIEMGTIYIGLNTKMAPFDDVAVRMAFAMSVDKKAIAEKVLYNLVLPADTILPPGMPGYREGYEGIPYDPETARQLLSASKYGGPGGLGRIKITISGGGSGSPSIVIQSIVEMWRQNLGVEVEIDSIDYVSFLGEMKKGRFQMFSMGWIADYSDPYDFLDLKLHGERSIANNETGYRNPEVDRLLNMARIEQNQTKRIELYHEAENLIVNDVPWLLLYHSKNTLLVKPYVKGYFPTPLGIPMLRFMYFED